MVHRQTATRLPAARAMNRNPTSTISDVAARAGVNVSTASRVLRADANQRVRPETRDRILAAAKALNYEPTQQPVRCAAPAPGRWASSCL
jgi:transcriptional regulator with XRE-family HTH domain